MPNEVGRKRRTAWLLALLLLVLGATSGVAADRLFLRGPPRAGPPGPPPPGEVARRLTRDLDLTETQSRAVEEILAGRWRALRTLFERIDPEAEAIRKQADERIRALLDPEQQRRFDARVAEHERRRAEVRERMGRGGAVPPP
jgi:Spy/CpxP family protein refolding chaperone